MKITYTTNNARNGTSGVVDVLFTMTISLVIDATRHVGSGTIGTVCVCVSYIERNANTTGSIF